MPVPHTFEEHARITGLRKERSAFTAGGKSKGIMQKENSSDRSSAFTAGGNLCTLQDGHQHSLFFLSRGRRLEFVFALWQMKQHILHLPSSAGIVWVRELLTQEVRTIEQILFKYSRDSWALLMGYIKPSFSWMPLYVGLIPKVIDSIFKKIYLCRISMVYVCTL